MRFFKPFVSLPLRDSIQLVWSRITLSKITVFYFLFSFLHASLQIILQAEVFNINSQATNLINAVTINGNLTNEEGFALLRQSDLLWCTDPTKIPESCRTLWSNDDDSTQVPNGTTYAGAAVVQSSGPDQYAASATWSMESLSTNSPRIIGSGITKLPQPTIATLEAQPSAPTSTAILSAKEEEAIVAGILAEETNKNTKHGDNSALNAVVTQVLNDPVCLTALRWPLETLRNTKREDIVFLNFHVWVLGMSIVAVLNESLVHMLATLVTHALLTAWSIFQILNTRAFQNNFNRMITNGACQRSSLLPEYWRQRTMIEIPAAALNGAALVLSAFLTWRLVVTFNWATFKRIGANRKVSQTYNMVLVFSVALQLSLFFIIVSLALWIDQLCNGAIGMFALLMNVYKPINITVLILLLPWIVIGWKAVRNERRGLMAGFLLFDIVLVGGWASMFASTTFRLTFMQWRFFAIMSVLAVALTLSCLAFGIICRLNFGNNLKRHLTGQESIPDGFESVMPEGDRRSVYSYEEKVAFPESTLPAFSRVTTNGSTNSERSVQFFLGHGDSDKLTAAISRPIIVPRSRFSVDSIERLSRSDSGHQRNGSSQSKNSRRWIIE